MCGLLITRGGVRDEGREGSGEAGEAAVMPGEHAQALRPAQPALASEGHTLDPAGRLVVL